MVEEGDEGAEPGVSRRAFLKRMAVIGFAVPVVSSFALDAAASEPDHARFHLANQSGSTTPYDDYYFTYGNQSPPATAFPNQYIGNQYEPPGSLGSYYPNQYLGNQV